MDVTILFIIILLVIGGIVGFRRGATRELISLIGIFVVLILSFIFKNPISVFFYKHLPFFNFGGAFKGVTVINILLYETIAFLVIFSILCALLKLLLILTNGLERLFDTTILLGIPSKVIGCILGIIEVYIYIFLLIFILRSPLFNIKEVKQSEVCNIILKTPVLSKISDKTLRVVDEIIDLKDEYKGDNKGEFNQKALDIMIENNIITKKNAESLIESGKLKGVVVN